MIHAHPHNKSIHLFREIIRTHQALIFACEMGVIALAKILGVTPAIITRQANLTKKGLQLFENIHEKIHKFENELANRLDKNDISTAACVLSSMRLKIEERSLKNVKNI